MLSRKTYHSSYKAYLNYPVDRLLAILLGHFAQRMYLGHSCPNQHAVSIKIASQISQPHLGFHSHQTNHPDDQPSRPLRLYAKDKVHITANRFMFHNHIDMILIAEKLGQGRILRLVTKSIPFELSAWAP